MCGALFLLLLGPPQKAPQFNPSQPNIQFNVRKTQISYSAKLCRIERERESEQAKKNEMKDCGEHFVFCFVQSSCCGLCVECVMETFVLFDNTFSKKNKKKGFTKKTKATRTKKGGKKKTQKKKREVFFSPLEL